jgi:hypothetical protein
MAQSESPFACDMTAIAPEKRSGHIAVIKELFSRVQNREELTNGYAFHLPSDARTWMLAAEFVSLERFCCPFFDFKLEVAREGGSIRLTLTGREGVKPFIMKEIAEYLGQIVPLSRV